MQAHDKEDDGKISIIKIYHQEIPFQGLGGGQKLKKLSFKELVLLLLVSCEECGYKLVSHSTEIHYI